MLSSLCVCVTLAYIPLVKADHMVKPKSESAGTAESYDKGYGQTEGEVENRGQFFKLPHHKIMVQKRMFLNSP